MTANQPKLGEIDMGHSIRSRLKGRWIILAVVAMGIVILASWKVPGPKSDVLIRTKSQQQSLADSLTQEAATLRNQGNIDAAMTKLGEAQQVWLSLLPGVDGSDPVVGHKLAMVHYRMFEYSLQDNKRRNWVKLELERFLNYEPNFQVKQEQLEDARILLKMQQHQQSGAEIDDILEWVERQLSHVQEITSPHRAPVAPPSPIRDASPTRAPVWVHNGEITDRYGRLADQGTREAVRLRDQGDVEKAWEALNNAQAIRQTIRNHLRPGSPQDLKTAHELAMGCLQGMLWHLRDGQWDDANAGLTAFLELGRDVAVKRDQLERARGVLEELAPSNEDAGPILDRVNQELARLETSE